MKKNEIYDFEVIDNGMNFEGIAKKDDMVVFIPGAIITEKVRGKIIKVNKNYAIAKVEEILKKASFRETPFCEVFKTCGGCDAQNITYDMQLILKRNMVKSVLDKLNVEYEILENTVGMGLPLY